MWSFIGLSFYLFRYVCSCNLKNSRKKLEGIVPDLPLFIVKVTLTDEVIGDTRPGVICWFHKNIKIFYEESYVQIRRDKLQQFLFNGIIKYKVERLLCFDKFLIRIESRIVCLCCCLTLKCQSDLSTVVGKILRGSSFLSGKSRLLQLKRLDFKYIWRRLGFEVLWNSYRTVKSYWLNLEWGFPLRVSSVLDASGKIFTRTQVHGRNTSPPHTSNSVNTTKT